MYCPRQFRSMSRSVCAICLIAMHSMLCGRLRAQESYGQMGQGQNRVSQHGPTPEMAYSPGRFGPTAQNLYHQHPGDAPTYVNYGGQNLTPKYVAIRPTQVTVPSVMRATNVVATSHMTVRRNVAVVAKKRMVTTATKVDEEPRPNAAEVHPIHLGTRSSGF